MVLGSQGGQPSLSCPLPLTGFPRLPSQGKHELSTQVFAAAAPCPHFGAGQGVAPRAPGSQGSGLAKLCLSRFHLAFLAPWLKSLVSGGSTLGALPSITQAGNKKQAMSV